MDIKEKIQEYIDSKGINVNTLEKSLGVSSGRFRKAKVLSSDFVSAFLNHYDEVSSEWLFRDNGEMCKSDNNDIIYKGVQKVRRMISPPYLLS